MELTQINILAKLTNVKKNYSISELSDLSEND
jgi:hypothetical protein